MWQTYATSVCLSAVCIAVLLFRGLHASLTFIIHIMLVSGSKNSLYSWLTRVCLSPEHTCRTADRCPQCVVWQSVKLGSQAACLAFHGNNEIWLRPRASLSHNSTFFAIAKSIDANTSKYSSLTFQTSVARLCIGCFSSLCIAQRVFHRRTIASSFHYNCLRSFRNARLIFVFCFFFRGFFVAALYRRSRRCIIYQISVRKCRRLLIAELTSPHKQLSRYCLWTVHRNLECQQSRDRLVPLCARVEGRQMLLHHGRI